MLTSESIKSGSSSWYNECMKCIISNSTFLIKERTGSFKVADCSTTLESTGSNTEEAVEEEVSIVQDTTLWDSSKPEGDILVETSKTIFGLKLSIEPFGEIEPEM